MLPSRRAETRPSRIRGNPGTGRTPRRAAQLGLAAPGQPGGSRCGPRRARLLCPPAPRSGGAGSGPSRSSPPPSARPPPRCAPPRADARRCATMIDEERGTSPFLLRSSRGRVGGRFRRRARMQRRSTRTRRTAVRGLFQRWIFPAGGARHADLGDAMNARFGRTLLAAILLVAGTSGCGTDEQPYSGKARLQRPQSDPARGADAAQQRTRSRATHTRSGASRTTSGAASTSRT